MSSPAVDLGPASGFSWRRVGALFVVYRRRVAGVAALVLVSSGLGVVNPLLVKVVFDRALFGSGDGRARRLLQGEPLGSGQPG